MTTNGIRTAKDHVVVCGMWEATLYSDHKWASSVIKSGTQTYAKRVSGVQKLAKNLKTSSKEAKRQRHSDKQGEKEGVDQ